MKKNYSLKKFNRSGRQAMSGSFKSSIALIILFMSVIVLSALVVVPKVSAATTFFVDYDPVKNRIGLEGEAEFDITADSATTKDLIISANLPPSEATQWILSPSSFRLDADSSQTFRLKIIPKSTVGIGTYQLAVTFKANDGTQNTLNIPLSVGLDAFVSDYVPNVALNVVTPDSTDPRDKLKVTVLLRNRNQLDVQNLVVKVSSDIFYEEFNTTLGPRKEKTTDFSFELNPLQEPGEYSLNIQVYHPPTNKVVAEAETTFEIAAYSTITPKITKESRLFVTEQVVYLENEGNFERSKEITVAAPWLQRIFMSSEPKGEVTRTDEGTVLKWEPTLKPTETTEIKITWNYWPLAIVIAVLILIAILYFIFRSPIIVIKEAKVTSGDEEGVSGIKVRIFIKNRSRSPIRGISVNDRLPSITEFVEPKTLGSVKPTRVTHTSHKGTLLYWDVDKLDAYEERILTYQLKAKLKVVGEMTLPKVRVKFESGKGKERTTFSGDTFFFK